MIAWKLIGLSLVLLSAGFTAWILWQAAEVVRRLL